MNVSGLSNPLKSAMLRVFGLMSLATKVTLLLSAAADKDLSDADHNTALILACAFQRLEVVELLVEAGAYLDATNHNGATALMAASRKGYDDIVAVLLSRRAQADLADNAGNTPLICAAEEVRLKTASLLLEAADEANKLA